MNRQEAVVCEMGSEMRGRNWNRQTEMEGTRRRSACNASSVLCLLTLITGWPALDSNRVKGGASSHEQRLTRVTPPQRRSGREPGAHRGPWNGTAKAAMMSQTKLNSPSHLSSPSGVHPTVSIAIISPRPSSRQASSRSGYVSLAARRGSCRVLA